MKKVLMMLLGIAMATAVQAASVSITTADGSSTDCLLGFGGNIGLGGNITDNIGIFGQVGYEWVDKADIRAGGFRSEIDYSSLVVSAGLRFRF